MKIDITEQMPLIDIKEDIKNREFLFYNGTFILITSLNQKNQACVFDDKITDEAREYADKNTPQIRCLLKTKRKYVNKTRTDYWMTLFNLAVWNYLERHNKVTYMIEPKT